MPRESFQSGSVILVKRKAGDQWRLRYYDAKAQRNELIGTVKKYPTRAQAEKAAARMLEIINGPRTECITIGDLIARFEHEAMPKRETTAHSYRSILSRVRAEWGNTRIDQFVTRISSVKGWLENLTVIGRHPKPGAQRKVSPLYRTQVRNVLHLLFEKAMLWGALSVDRNPISLIKADGGSKRKKDLVVLTPEQYQALLDDADLPLLVKTLVQVCSGLGLRISEALGLRWDDMDFDKGELRIWRRVVAGKSDATKSKTSTATLPLHESLIAVLRQWRMAEKVVGGWVFGSERTGRPYDRDALRATYLQPSGDRIGVPGIGWHSLRHSHRAWLRESGAPLEAQKDLMRHSRIDMTMRYGGQDKVEALRPANAAVIDILTRRTA